MADIATLGFAVDSTQVQRAARELGTLTTAAAKAEDATQAMGQASQRAATGTQAMAAQVQAAVTNHNRLTSANDNLQRSTLRNAETFRQLTFQINDAATMALSGASAFQILATQGGQVFQAMQQAEGGVSGFMRQLMGMITPLRLAGTAAVSAAALVVYANMRWSDSQQELTRALYGTGLSAGVTAEQINKLAERTASAAGVSQKLARESIAALAAMGNVDPTILGRAPGLSRGIQAQLAIDAAEANQLLAQSLKNPTEGYLRITNAIGGYNVIIDEQIRRLQAQGRLYEAQQVLIAQIPGRLAPVEKVTSDWARAWQAVNNAVSDLLDKVARLTGGPLGRFMDAYANFSKRVDAAGGGDTGARRVAAQDNANADVQRIADQIADLQRRTDDIRSGARGLTGQAAKRIIDANEAEIGRLSGQLDQAERRADAINRRMGATSGDLSRPNLNGSFARAEESSQAAAQANSMADALERAGRASAQRAQVERQTSQLAEERARVEGEASRSVQAGVTALQNSTSPTVERIQQISAAVDKYNAYITALQQFNRQPEAARNSPEALRYQQQLQAGLETTYQYLQGNLRGGIDGLVDGTGRIIAGWEQVNSRIKSTVDLTREQGEVERQTIQAQGQSATQQEAALRRQIQLRQQNDPRSGSQAERQAEQDREIANFRQQNLQNLIVAQQERARSVMLATDADRAQMSVQNGSIEQQERMRVSMQLINDARREYIRLTGNPNAQVPEAEAAAYRKLAEEMARVRQLAAEKRVMDDAMFNLQTMFLPDSERGVATQLRSLYGDQWQSQMDGAIAQQLRFNEQLRTANDLAQDFGRTFVSDMMNGKSATEALGNALKGVAARLLQMAADQAIRSLFNGIMGSFGGFFGGGGGSTGTALLANGGVVHGGNIIPFARGGMVTDRPIMFPMANGAGLIGETGPEAALPLKRDNKGRLGVIVAGGGGGAATSIRMGDTNITIQGSASGDTVAQLKAELDARDARMRQEIPGLVTQARRDRTLRSA